MGTTSNAAIERQMRYWELARSQKDAPAPAPAPDLGPFLCISRMVGVDGNAVADKLAEELGWAVFDKEILNVMAGDDFDRKVIYESLDERDIGWSEEMIRGFFEKKFVKNDYFRRLCETFFLLARKGNAVFLGRGADLVLPRSAGFRVRLSAPYEQRVAWLAAARDLSPTEAAVEIEHVEHKRRQYFENHFHVTTDDPARYDLTVNMGSFDTAQAVALIQAARRIHAAGF